MHILQKTYDHTFSVSNAAKRRSSSQTTFLEGIFNLYCFLPLHNMAMTSKVCKNKPSQTTKSVQSMPDYIHKCPIQKQVKMAENQLATYNLGIFEHITHTSIIQQSFFLNATLSMSN